MNLAYVVNLLFTSYTVLLFLRIATSWFPAWRYTHFVRFISFYTDPYLNVFRRLLPPLGGVLDLSPILAFFALRILQSITVNLLR